MPKLRYSILPVLLLVYSCAIFQKDPTGATLYSMKSVYEGIVNSAGQAYLNKQITRDQLLIVVDNASRFHATYVIALNFYSANQLPDASQRIVELQKALDELQNILQTMIAKQPPEPAIRTFSKILTGVDAGIGKRAFR